MLARQIPARVARPLIRLASSSSVATNTVTPLSKVVPQAPNFPTTWSTNQAPRPQGNSGPRFEQTAMELQPNPLSAMEMIASEPIRLVHGRKAVCDGGTYTCCLRLWYNSSWARCNTQELALSGTPRSSSMLYVTFPTLISVSHYTPIV